MAITIRKLSKEAEKNLLSIMDKEEINTKTKAIEFALKKYSRIEELKSIIDKLKKENYNLEEQINDFNYVILEIKNLVSKIN